MALLCCLEAYWPMLAAVFITFGVLRWLLSAPYRGVGTKFYESPRRFLLTGCASGMGRHLTGVLLRNGHQVLATDLNEAQVREVAAADGWEALAKGKAALRVRALDVSDRGQWEAALAEVDRVWGGLDVCMNIAGLVIPRKIQDVQNAREIDLHIDVMVKGPIHGTQLAAALMARRGIKGHVINVSSMAAVGPVAGVTLYATARPESTPASHLCIVYVTTGHLTGASSRCCWRCKPSRLRRRSLSPRPLGAPSTLVRARRR